MGRRKGAMAHIYCKTCSEWFDASLDVRPMYCIRCGSPLTDMRCNRCGYEWRVKKKAYPKYCPDCKSPYYNRVRINRRKDDEISSDCN